MKTLLTTKMMTGKKKIKWILKSRESLPISSYGLIKSIVINPNT